MKETFVDRLIREQSELNDRLTKLGDFLHSQKATEIENEQLKLLWLQHSVMTSYSMILQLRIAKL